MKKRVLAVLLSLALAVSMLGMTACGSKEDSGEIEKNEEPAEKPAEEPEESGPTAAD